MLCLPSHREGFGNVIIEAASCHLPAIASNIYGLNDAVQDGYSGLLHEVKSSASIQQCMECVLNNPSKTDAMKNNARKRVKKVFDEKLLINEFIAFYKSMLK
jgi:glycosyltransferase involved in cell wall biosynthesis